MVGSRSRHVGGAISCLVISLWAAGGCTSSDGGRRISTTGAAGTSSQAGTSGAAGTTGGTGGGTTGGASGTTGGTAGTTGGGTGAGTAGSGAAGSAGGSTGMAGAPDASDAAAGAAGSDAGTKTDAASPPFDAFGRTPPTCKTPKPSPIPSQKPTNECDYLLQSLDFEDMYSYVSPTIEITSFGTALGAWAINNCSPYCYSKELTIGVDIVGGGDASQLKGEVIVHFPTTGPELPIATAVGRDSLAWINLDGPTAPPFTITAQLVVETSTGAIIPANEMKQVGYANWLDYQHAEFKYFGIQAPPGGPFPTTPTDITGIGFRIMAPANLAKGMEWHGVVYLDHLQIRKGPENSPPGNYPYGL
jgi:hypothetical protein